jgi:hypothetical protein
VAGRTLAYAGIATEPNGQGIGTRAHNFSPAQKHGNKSARKTDEHEGDAGTPGCWAVGANSTLTLCSRVHSCSIRFAHQSGKMGLSLRMPTPGRKVAWKRGDSSIALCISHNPRTQSVAFSEPPSIRRVRER